MKYYFSKKYYQYWVPTNGFENQKIREGEMLDHS